MLAGTQAAGVARHGLVQIYDRAGAGAGDGERSRFALGRCPSYQDEDGAEQDGHRYSDDQDPLRASSLLMTLARLALVRLALAGIALALLAFAGIDLAVLEQRGDLRNERRKGCEQRGNCPDERCHAIEDSHESPAGPGSFRVT